MAEFSPVKWSKYLGYHMVVKKGTHIDDNLGKFCDVILGHCCCHNGDNVTMEIIKEH